MTNDELMVSELTRDEGKVDSAYQDHLGYWTIGVGRLIDKRKGGRLTDEEINYLLMNDIKEKASQLTANLPWWKSLDEVRRRVILNMAFNLGIAGLLKFKNTLRFIETGNYTQAARNMEQSLWYKQVGKRAKRLVYMMEYGKVGDWRSLGLI